MLLAILFLCGSALLGIALVRNILRQYLNSTEQILWGLVSGWCVSTLCIYLLAYAQGKLNRQTVIWTTIFITALGLVLLIRQRSINVKEPGKLSGREGWLAPALRRLKPSQPNYALLLTLVLFTPIYWTLFSSHFFPRDSNGIHSGGSAFADLSFHAAITTSFLYGDNFPTLYTPHAGDPMLYPFLPDFQTAILMCAGMNMRNALLLTSMVLALATTGLVFYLAIRIFENQIVGILATILFFLNGGLGFIDLIRDWLHGSKSFLAFWGSMQVNYANYADRALHWPNLITDGFVPQRTVLFGLPVTLMVLTAFAEVWRNHSSQKKLFVFAGALSGLLPLFHVHSFIAICLVGAVLFILRPNRLWLWFWGALGLVAVTPVSMLFLRAAQGGIIRFQPGWMGHSQSFWPLYILRNLGLPLLLSIPALLVVKSDWRKFYVAFVVLLVFALTIVVSPNIFDNGKLIYYWHAVNAAFVANFLVRLSFDSRQRVLATVLALVCIGTGISALQSERLQSAVLFSEDDIAASEFARLHTSTHSIFLTAPVTNQPILALAGRRIVRGPTAWLWSHGIEFRDREADVRRIYRGADDSKDLLSRYGVDFVYVGEAERLKLKANVSFFDTNFECVYRGPTNLIYDVRNARGEGRARALSSVVTYDPFALLFEFPRVGFFVYRSWLVTKGRMPTRDEFTQTMSTLGHNVLLGFDGVEQQLQLNKAQLVRQLSLEVSATTSADYVAALLSNARLNDGALQRELVTALESQSISRELVLARIIENKTLVEREYNTAFVLVHYFGYLNRNPYDPPDQGLDGLKYWVRILDESGDYRSLSRAFLESDEYQRR